MVKSFFLQLFIFIVIFQGYSWYQELDMLPESETAISATSELMSISGERIHLVADDKPTVLYFFAPWCHVCNLSIGNLEALHQDNSTLNIVAVALDYNTQEEIQQYAQKHKLTFPVLLGSGNTKNEFKISAYPSYYVLDKNQRVVARSVGYSSEFGLYLRTLDL